MENVEIIEPYDLDFKKNKVIDKAFLSAFKIIISRVVISEDIKKINLNNLNEVKPMIDSFSIIDEKFMDNNYSAKFDILFDKKKIIQFLNSKGVISSSPIKKKILLIPIFINLTNNELLMFEENQFYNNWNKNISKADLINYSLPNEDLQDFNIIKKNLINIENYDFNEILKKYNNSNYIICIVFQDINKLKVLSKINFDEKISLVNSEYIISDKKNESFNKTITNLKIVYENYWKKVNEINTSIKLSLTVSLNSKNIELINKFENELNNSDLVYKFDIEKIDNFNTFYKIIYNSSPDKFINNFENKEFKLDISNKIWKIYE